MGVWVGVSGCAYAHACVILYVCMYFVCTLCSILYRVMAALNFLRYLLIRDKLVDNKVREVHGGRLKLCIECQIFFAWCYTDRGVEHE